MDLSPADLVGIFDRIGIVAFAVSGVEVGVRRKLDMFGLLVMALVTATGGGAMRDIALGRLPLVLDKPDYLLFGVGAGLVGIALAWRGRAFPRLGLAVADAVGLGAFAAAGAIAAIELDLALPAVILLAVLTATGGGVLRDLLAARVPLVLRSEINATAAALGGLAVWAVEPLSLESAALTGAAVTAAVRVAGIAFDRNLPIPGGRRGKQGRLF